MLPPYFQFYNPVKILSGKKALENIPFELELLNAGRPMIVTDQGVVQAGLIDIVTAALGGSTLPTSSSARRQLFSGMRSAIP